MLKVEVRDGGSNPHVTEGEVQVVVDDVNDHAPVFNFPNTSLHAGDQAVTFLWSVSFGEPITQVNASDLDLGLNKVITYRSDIPGGSDLG